MAAPPRRPTGFVTDAARVLDGPTRAQLEALLADLERKTSAEVAVVTATSLDGRPINEVAVSLEEAWGIGKKGKDNGVLFLIAPNERKVWIEVGYGLEGVIPDSLAGRILGEVVIPSFKAGDLSGGIQAGAVAIIGVIAQDAGVQVQAAPGAMPGSRDPRHRKPSIFERLIGLLFILIMIPLVIRHPWLLFFLLGGRGGGWSGGGFGGGFGGFGGGMSGGGGAGRSW